MSTELPSVEAQIGVGLYLFFSLSLFGRHLNESFSTPRIEDWKGFLRIRISPDGALEGFFFGIDRVPPL